MASKELMEFRQRHPFPQEAGITKLFKYFRFDDQHPEYIERLFDGLLLYCALPEQFNDPFECKPHWRMPESFLGRRKLNTRLEAIAERNGKNKRGAKAFASQAMRNPRETEEQVQRSIISNIRKLRICCFSTSRDNILLWSHYADSHKGICVEFDATMLPIAISRKVHYQDDYPNFEYPLPDKEIERGYSSILTKARHWSYEDEYRAVLVADEKSQPLNDGENFLLYPPHITAVYFGAEVSHSHRDFVVSLIRKSKVTPSLYQATLGKSSFSLEFKPLWR